ncbi:hypothetical protein [Kitasatospora sp. NPDC094015]|uniref:hypothetical protein n=1 Tax=Kitasatospora sp. NPDC094015 TaxID=3155205 RepID=UPI00331F4FF3
MSAGGGALTAAGPAAADIAPVGTTRSLRTAFQWSALAVLFLLGVLELFGGTGGLVGSSRAAEPSAGTSSVETLARRIGCTAEITATTADLRQGVCTSAGEEIWIATFPNSGARDSWTTEAKAYGGSYLVGDGWAVVLSESTADLLHGLLGGEIVNGVDHTGHAQAAGG